MYKRQVSGRFLQLAGVLGVEKETGFTLGYDKYNWEEHPQHFILADCTGPVDFGEGKKSIYALEGAQVLVQRDKEVQMAVNEFGAGRAVYPVSYTHLAVVGSVGNGATLRLISDIPGVKYTEGRFLPYFCLLYTSRCV